MFYNTEVTQSDATCVKMRQSEGGHPLRHTSHMFVILLKSLILQARQLQNLLQNGVRQDHETRPTRPWKVGRAHDRADRVA